MNQLPGVGRVACPATAVERRGAGQHQQRPRHPRVRRRRRGPGRARRRRVLPSALGSRATVVDRTTWTVSATPDYGRFIDSGSQPAFDGAAIYVIADKATGTIVVIDPTTFEITGEIRTLATGFSQPNSLAASPGVLWAANNGSGLLQRFDTAG